MANDGHLGDRSRVSKQVYICLYNPFLNLTFSMNEQMTPRHCTLNYCFDYYL